RREQARVDVGERLVHAEGRRALKQGRELDQLEVTGDAVGNIEFGVQAQLAQAPTDPAHALEHLLAQPAEGLVQLVAGRLVLARRTLNALRASKPGEVAREVGERGLR